MDVNCQIRDIILQHYKMYPQMELIDYIKLIYQNEFGGGHLILDKEKSLQYLKVELKSIANENIIDKIVPIGNNIARVYLSSLEEFNISVEQFNDMFVESSSLVRGSIDSFKSKLEILLELAKDEKISIDFFVAKKFLDKYEKENYPMVSHSPTFRENYKPHYRIIDLDILNKNINNKEQ